MNHDTANAIAMAAGDYRDQCVRNVSATLAGSSRCILHASYGFGTAGIAIGCARTIRARNMLLVVPKDMAGSVIDACTDEGATCRSAVGMRKDSVTTLCREAMDQKAAPISNSSLAVYIVTPNQLPAIGSWHEAWQKDPFDFIFVWDIATVANEKSEKGRGIRTAARYARGSVIFADSSRVSPAVLKKTAETWGRVVSDRTGPATAASACEAAGMSD